MAEQIWSRLLQSLRRQAQQRTHVPKSRVHRSAVVSLCILVAVVLWLTLSLADTYTYVASLEMRVTDLHEDSALAALPPAAVEVRLSGSGTALLRTRFNGPVLELSAVGSEIDTRSALQLSPEIAVIDVVPERIELAKDVRHTRRIPIESRVELEPIAAYDLFEQPVLQPDSVVVTGARSVVDRLEFWPTEPMRFSRIRDTLVTSIPLADTLSELVTIDQSSIILSARAYRFTEASRVLPVTVTELPTAQPIVLLDPPEVEVIYRLPLFQYEAAQAAVDMFVTVSYETILADTTAWVEPQINVPEDLLIRLKEVTPPRLRYFIYIGTQ